MVYGTGLIQGSGTQWRQGRGIDKCALLGVDIYSTVYVIVIRATHGDFLVASFV